MLVRQAANGKIALTTLELDYLQSLLSAGDRTGFYMAYYNMTGSEQAILQAQISSFSEGPGGAAYIGNYLLQSHFGPTGNYAGIYFISQQVAQSAFNKIFNDIIFNHGDGFIDSTTMLTSAAEAWENLGQGDQFPGNLLQGGLGLADWLQHLAQLGVNPTDPTLVWQNILDLWIGSESPQGFISELFSTGSLAALVATATGSVLFAKRSSDYENRPEYVLRETPDGEWVSAIRVADGKTVAVFEDDPFIIDSGEELLAYLGELLGQIALLPFLPILPFVVSALSDFRRSLTEHTPGFDGEVPGIPHLSNPPFVDPISTLRQSPTSGADTLWGTDGFGGFFADDLINSGGGSDVVFGGDGDDELHGGTGDDVLYGQKDEDHLFGDEGDDVLRGGEDDDILEGGIGDDLLDGGDNNSDYTSGDDTLRGGDGADILRGGDGNDTLYGDAGFDRYVFHTGDGNDQIKGDDNDGTIVINSIELRANSATEFGTESAPGWRWTYNNDVFTYKLDGATQALAGNRINYQNGTLSIRHIGANDKVTVDNYSTTDLSLDLFRKKNQDPDDGAPGAPSSGGAASATLGTIPPRRDPLVLDLDGDGIETTSPSSGNVVLFDHDADGIKTGTGWVKPDDGWLVLDRDGSGTIDTGRELFGVDTIKTNGQLAKDGFDALRDLDANQDGLINASDAVFENLRIWRDLNQDGVTQLGELTTLAANSIVSVGVISSSMHNDLGNGNVQTAAGVFTRSNGSTGITGETVFETANLDLLVNTFYRTFTTQIPLTEQTLALPGVRGSGMVRDFREAATLSTDLYDWAADYVAQATRQGQLNALDGLIDRWADTSEMGSLKQQAAALATSGVQLTYALDGIATNSAAYNEFIRKLGVVERFVGFTYGGGGGQARFTALTASAGNFSVHFGTEQIANIANAYDRFAADIYESLVNDTRLKPLVDAVLAGVETETPDFSILESQLSSGIALDARQGAIDMVEFVSAYGSARLQSIGWDAIGFIASQLSTAPDIAGFSEQLTAWSVRLADANQHQLFGGSHADLLVGTNDNDSLIGNDGNDVLIGKAGDDYLDGGAGADVLEGGDGVDYLFAGAGADVIHGAQGDDHLFGDAGDDVYIFGRGDGADTIEIEWDTTAGKSNTLRFQEGILPSDVIASQDGGAGLLLTIASTSDSVRVIGYFAPIGASRDENLALQRIEFSNGVVWDENILVAKVFAGSINDDLIQGFDNIPNTIHGDLGNDRLFGGESADTLYGDDGDDVIDARSGDDTVYGSTGIDTINGDSGNDTIFGGDGNDVLSGGEGDDVIVAGDGDDIIYGETYVGDAKTGNDTIDGGAGNDLIFGGRGNNTYLFGTGSGQDTIVSSMDDNASKVNTLVLGSNILPTDLKFDYVGDDLVLSIIGTTDKVTINNFFADDDLFNLRNPIQQLTFSNGVTWSLNDVLALLLGGSNAGEYMRGTYVADTIAGQGGDDEIYGRGGNDTINGGDGADLLFGENGDDRLNGGNDSDTLDGGLGNDTLDGGAGNDILLTSEDNDTYLFGVGAGHDVLYGARFGAAVGTVQLENGVTPDDVRLTRSSGKSLVISVLGSSDTLSIPFYYYDQTGFQQLRFEDGTTWSSFYLMDAFSTSLSMANLDTVEVFGNNLDNLITGTQYSNIINGGAGIDTMIGGAGDDTYVVDDTGGVDFEDGWDDGSQDIVLENAGEGYDTLAVTSYSALLPANVEQLTAQEFVGNFNFYHHGADIRRHFTGNALDNVIDVSGLIRVTTFGLPGTYLDGGLGADLMIGGETDDTFVVDNTGDVVVETAVFSDNRQRSIDTVESSISYVLNNNVENLILTGSDAISGTGNDLDNDMDGSLNLSANILTGGLGNDIYRVGAGDTVVENAGEGIDTVVISAGPVGTYSLAAFDNVENMQLAETMGNSGLVGNSENNVLQGNEGTNSLDGGNGDDKLVDGSFGSFALDSDYLFGGSGNDALYSYRGFDTLDGGTGDDYLRSYGYGVRTIVFGRSYGNDTFVTNGDTGSAAQIQLLSNISQSQVVLSRDNADLMVGIAGDTGSLRISYFFEDGYSEAPVPGTVQRIAFADGTDWNQSMILKRLLATTGSPSAGDDFVNGTSAADNINVLSGNDVVFGLEGDDLISGDAGDDELWGEEGNDTISGGADNDTLLGGSGDDILTGGSGNDMLRGGSGADSYHFGIGFGQDVIEDSANGTGEDASVDEVVFDVGINPSDIQLSITQDLNVARDLVVTNLTTGDQITIRYYFGSESGFTLSDHIEQFRFANGVTWDTAEIRRQASFTYGTAADDSLYGLNGLSMSMFGFAGNDRLDGANGNDLLDGGADNDILHGYEGTDTLLGGDGNDQLDGGDGDDSLQGGNGNDILTDHLGTNSLQGGAGNDTYYVGNAVSFGSVNVVTEAAGEGIDTVHSNGSFTLGSDIENLTLDPTYNSGGAEWTDGTGNNLANQIVGTNVRNFLTGLDGDDNIDGMSGSDTIYGGDGDDTLFGGSDSLFLYTDGTGGHISISLENTDFIDGGQGNDHIDGGSGNDTLLGGIGNDQIYGGNDGGVSGSGGYGGGYGGGFSGYLSNNDYLEGGDGDDFLDGGSGNDTLMGGAGSDQLFGGADGTLNTTNNDTLDGGAGIDYMVGGSGNDTYYVDGVYVDVPDPTAVDDCGDPIVGATTRVWTTDVIAESVGQGYDVVYSSASLALPRNFEAVYLVGTDNLNVTGNIGDQLLVGNDGNNRIDGGTGNDTLQGGLGDDTYVIDNSNDVVVENAGEGNDTIVSSFDYSLATGASNVENLTLLSVASGGAAIHATGNAGDNILIGNELNNVIDGGDGDDTINGGAGNDTLNGGLGGDLYKFGLGSGVDQVFDVQGHNRVHLLGDLAASGITLTHAGNDLVVTVNGTADQLTLVGWNAVSDLQSGNIELCDGTPLSGNQAPTATNDFASVVEDTSLVANGNVLTNDSDPDAGTTLTVANAGTYSGAFGTLALSANGQYSYTLNNALTGVQALRAGQTLVDTFTYAATDGQLQANAALLVAVNGTNDAPVANNDTGAVNEDGTLVVAGNVLSNDTDVDNATVLTVTTPGTIAGAYGTFTVTANGSYSYTLNNASPLVQSLAQGEVVTESFNYTARDNDSVPLSSSATVGITITGSNDAPYLVIPIADIAVKVNQAFSFVLPQDTFKDIDHNAVLTYSATLTNGDPLPTGITFDPLTRQFSGTTAAADAGHYTTPYQFRATATDQFGASASDDFTVLVSATETMKFAGYAWAFTPSTWASGTTSLGGADISGKVRSDVIYIGQTTKLDGSTGNDAILLDNNLDLASTNIMASRFSINSVGGGDGDDVIDLTSARYSLGGVLLQGGNGNDILIGGNGNDLLDGGTGDDSMRGGLGDDTYYVDSTSDVVIENVGGGTDLVRSYVNYTLSANVENLTLFGSNTTGAGNALDNVLTGNGSNDTLTGNAGNDTLDPGSAGTDVLLGGTGDDQYNFSRASATGVTITENAGEGIDTLSSNVTVSALAANVEILFLTYGATINGTGNTLANLIRGNVANNTLAGGGGTDILEGDAGNDILSNASGSNSLLNGGAGTDTLTGTTANDLLIGGIGNDAITTGTGADIIAFNKGDGQDTIAVSTVKDNVVSLGGGVLYSDLLFQKSGNNLILKVSATDKITFTNYYSATANRSVSKLQIVIEGTTDYNAGSGTAMNNKKIETFNFDGLVTAFDAARTANPSLTTWALTNALSAQYLTGSDTAAIGGDLAYRYHRFGTLSDVAFTDAIPILSAGTFGTAAQTLVLPAGPSGSGAHLLSMPISGTQSDVVSTDTSAPTTAESYATDAIPLLFESQHKQTGLVQSIESIDVENATTASVLDASEVTDVPPAAITELQLRRWSYAQLNQIIGGELGLLGDEAASSYNPTLDIADNALVSTSESVRRYGGSAPRSAHQLLA